MSIAQSLHEASLKSSTQNRRQVHSNVQDKINDWVGDIRLYEKGLKVEIDTRTHYCRYNKYVIILQLFPAALQPQLVKYLLKSLGNDVCNEIFVYVAKESSLNYEGDLTVEQRIKLQQECGK